MPKPKTEWKSLYCSTENFSGIPSQLIYEFGTMLIFLPRKLTHALCGHNEKENNAKISYLLVLAGSRTRYRRYTLTHISLQGKLIKPISGPLCAPVLDRYAANNNISTSTHFGRHLFLPLDDHVMCVGCVIKSKTIATNTFGRPTDKWYNQDLCQPTTPREYQKKTMQYLFQAKAEGERNFLWKIETTLWWIICRLHLHMDCVDKLQNQVAPGSYDIVAAVKRKDYKRWSEPSFDDSHPHWQFTSHPHTRPQWQMANERQFCANIHRMYATLGPPA